MARQRDVERRAISRFASSLLSHAKCIFVSQFFRFVSYLNLGESKNAENRYSSSGLNRGDDYFVQMRNDINTRLPRTLTSRAKK